MDISTKPYNGLLLAVKTRIRQAQTKATLAANAEMVLVYWDIGRLIHKRQQKEGWGAAVIPRLAKDLRNEVPDIKGFSERNIKRMLSFYRQYPSLAIVPPPVALSVNSCDTEEMPQPVAQLNKGKAYQLLKKLRLSCKLKLMDNQKISSVPIFTLLL